MIQMNEDGVIYNMILKNNMTHDIVVHLATWHNDMGIHNGIKP